MCDAIAEFRQRKASFLGRDVQPIRWLRNRYVEISEPKQLFEFPNQFVDVPVVIYPISVCPRVPPANELVTDLNVIKRSAYLHSRTAKRPDIHRSVEECNDELNRFQTRRANRSCLD